MLSRKKSRVIVFEGQKYRWSVSGDSGYSVLVVQHTETDGQRLEIITSLVEGPTVNAITPSFVVQTIKDALKTGWTPLQKAPPLELSLNAVGRLEIRRGLATG